MVYAKHIVVYSNKPSLNGNSDCIIISKMGVLVPVRRGMG